MTKPLVELLKETVRLVSSVIEDPDKFARLLTLVVLVPLLALLVRILW